MAEREVRALPSPLRRAHGNEDRWGSDSGFSARESETTVCLSSVAQFYLGNIIRPCLSCHSQDTGDTGPGSLVECSLLLSGKDDVSY